MAFELTSPSFSGGGDIPKRHCRRGDNLSPFLQWHDPPPGTQSYVLSMEDPDAPSGVLRHWIVFDIPGDRRQLAEGRSSKARTEDLPHAYNDFGHLHYDGPDVADGAPPHTYRFRLAALSVPRLDVGSEPDASKVWEAARHQLLGEAELNGTSSGK